METSGTVPWDVAQARFQITVCTAEAYNRCSVWGIYGKLAAGYVILVTNGMFEFTARGGKL
jgi:hypothetical protein